MKNAIRVTLAVLCAKLAAMKNPRVLRISFEKTADPAKRLDGKGKIVRLQKGGLEVNRKDATPQEREAAGLEATPGPLPWGEWMGSTGIVIRYGDKFYLRAKATTETSAGACGIVLETSYRTVNGVPLWGGHQNDLVQKLVFRKADGVTPLAGKKKSTDLGVRNWGLSDASYVCATIDGETYDATPQNE